MVEGPFSRGNIDAMFAARTTLRPQDIPVISDYNGPWAEISFVVEMRNGDVTETLSVPFSETEIQTIQEMRAIHAKWQHEALRGSGWTRELYAGIFVPWAHVLKDRKRALDDMNKALGELRIIRQSGIERGSKEMAGLSGDLSEIEEKLLTFLPDEREPKPSTE